MHVMWIATKEFSRAWFNSQYGNWWRRLADFVIYPTYVTILHYCISWGITRIFSLPEGYKGKYDPHFSPSGYRFDQSEPLFCFMQAIISSDLQTLYHISTTASYAYGAHTITVCVPQRITQIWEADAHYLTLLIRANYLSFDLPRCKLSSILD